MASRGDAAITMQFDGRTVTEKRVESHAVLSASSVVYINTATSGGTSLTMSTSLPPTLTAEPEVVISVKPQPGALPTLSGVRARGGAVVPRKCVCACVPVCVHLDLCVYMCVRACVCVYV